MEQTEQYREIVAPQKRLKRIYMGIMLWFVGRAIQAAARTDQTVRDEFARLPEKFTFGLGVMPDGPFLIVGKTKEGRVKYLGSDPERQPLDLALRIKNIEAGMLMFTFQEATAIAVARERLTVDGLSAPACAVVRILNIVEVYLLPEIIAKLAVKRYPRWPLSKKLWGRTRIYVRTVLGF